MPVFQGAYTALVTPFRDGAVDEKALVRLVEFQIENGIDGLVPCGTTGESATLSHAEHIRVIEIVVRTVRGRVPVLAGAGSNCTQEAIELSQACRELGVEGLLHVTPYYNRPPPEGLVAHFHAIAHATDLPIVVYNVPSRTCSDVPAEVIAAIARDPRIVGVKEATADMERASSIRELCGPDFALLSGDDASVLPFLAVGGHGVVSVVSNCIPDLVVALCRAMARGDLETARALHQRQLPLVRALFAATNPMPVKAALALMGHISPELRLPLVPLASTAPGFANLRRELEILERLP